VILVLQQAVSDGTYAGKLFTPVQFSLEGGEPIEGCTTPSALMHTFACIVPVIIIRWGGYCAAHGSLALL
jgi:hypothetical protein